PSPRSVVAGREERPDPPAPAQRHRERGRLARWDRSRVVLDEIARDVGPVEQRERLLRVRADLERLTLGDGAELDLAAVVLDHHTRQPATGAALDPVRQPLGHVAGVRDRRRPESRRRADVERGRLVLVARERGRRVIRPPRRRSDLLPLPERLLGEERHLIDRPATPDRVVRVHVLSRREDSAPKRAARAVRHDHRPRARLVRAHLRPERPVALEELSRAVPVDAEHPLDLAGAGARPPVPRARHRRRLVDELVELRQVQPYDALLQHNDPRYMRVERERETVRPPPDMPHTAPHRQRRRRRRRSRSENEVRHRSTADSRARVFSRRRSDSRRLTASCSSLTIIVPTSGAPPIPPAAPAPAATGTVADSDAVNRPSVSRIEPNSSSRPSSKPCITSRPLSRRIFRSTSAGPFQSGSRFVSPERVLRTLSNIPLMPSMNPCTTRRPASRSQVPAPDTAPTIQLLMPCTVETTPLMPFWTAVLMPVHTDDTYSRTPPQFDSHSDRIVDTTAQHTGLTVLIAPETTDLIVAHTPETICRIPFQTPDQSPRIADVTTLITPCTTDSADLMIADTAENTVCTTGRSAWITGISSPASICTSG